MGKTRDYLGFVPAGNLNIIASGASNVSFVTLENQEGRFIAAAGCEHVYIWDMKNSDKARVFNGEKTAVTSICVSPNKEHLAVGYADGLTNIFDLNSGELLYPFHGHNSAITSLAFNQPLGWYLATGANDTDIVVWDMFEEKGKCRLSGHTGPITKLVFISKMQDMNILISASKDTFVKFWDWELKYCIKTLVGFGTEVWSIELMNNDQFLVAAAADQTLSVWKLIDRNEEDENDIKKYNIEISEDDDEKHRLQCFKFGTVARATTGRRVFMSADPTGQILACHSKNKFVELFQFFKNEEAEAKLKKRMKKLRKKQKSEGEEIEEQSLSVVDVVKRLQTINLNDKPKSLDLLLGRESEVRVAVCLENNQLQLLGLNLNDANQNEAKCLRNIGYMKGHQSEVRAVTFSSDNQVFVTGSGESIKSWKWSSQLRIATLETGYILCLIFAPGDRYILAGTKEGKLLIVDIATSEIKEEIDAHDDEIWSICLTSDMRGIVTGGSDQTVKFWQFDLIKDKTNEDSRGKVLSVIHTRTLKLEDGVLCVCVSQNGKYVAVALLDTTVKIFYVDSFKLFMSLYGHSLPVLTMDISSDSALIATGSSDRNVKIWGMDYGNCHKSLFAHDDSVTGLKFLPGTHLFFTCGKDGKVKHWDGDSFQRIMVLHGHIGEAYGLAVSPNGKNLVTCGSDRVLRLYKQSDEIVEITDQAEMEREQQEPLATGPVTVVPGLGELNLPSKKTLDSETGAEKILEALEVISQYEMEMKCSRNVSLPDLMRAYQVETTDQYLMKMFESIRPSEMEQALLLLPMDAAVRIIKFCPHLLEKKHDSKTLLDIYTFLLMIHHSAIMQNMELYEPMEKFTKLIGIQVKKEMDLIGRNLYALKYMMEEKRKTNGYMEFQDLSTKKRKYSMIAMKM